MNLTVSRGIVFMGIIMFMPVLDVLGQGYLKPSARNEKSRIIYIKKGQRHRRGIQGIELSAGLATSKYLGSAIENKNSYGIVGNAGYSRYISSRLYYKGNFFHQTDNINSLTHNSSGLEFTFALTLWRLSNSIYINPTIGAIASYDTYKSESVTDVGVLKYGGSLGLEGEIFFDNHFSIIVNVNRRYLIKHPDLSSQYEDNQLAGWWFLTVGIRYHYYKGYLDCL